ncbi:MAG TPA: hypothetical protein DD670_00550 [Planctomycetaceae bacterium]|nr:hypothetical protein [Planctomycetaceae bacterium]
MRLRIRMSVAASIVVAMNLFLAASANADLTTGLALYCDMEDTDAINVDKVLPDVYGAQLVPGTVVGNVTQAVDAERGNVLSFDTRSSSNYVDFGDNLDPGTTSYTVAMWMKRDDLTSTEFPAAKGNSSTTAEAWSFGLRAGSHASGPGLSVRANYDGGSGTTRQNTVTEGLTDAGKVLDGVWYHLAMVINQETGHFYAYINGVGSGEDGDNGLWDSNEASYSVTFPNNGTADFNTTLALTLGKVAGTTNTFKGDIDDFAVWTRALSSDEIVSIYNGAAIVPEPGLLALLSGMVLFGLASRRGRKL